jgi:uncharacterized damage-inducible protein DinB
MDSTPVNQHVPKPSDLGREYIAYCRRRLVSEYLPRIERCMNELTDDDAWWRAHESDNSIANLLLHLNGNVRQWIVNGFGDSKDDTRNRPREFSERTRIAKNALVENLRKTVEEADSVLKKFSAERLLDTVHIQEYDVTYLDALSHVVEHFAQHLGQIIYVTKLRTGKDLKFYDL